MKNWDADTASAPCAGTEEKMGEGYETVIGLEVHVELATKTKIFCGCPTVFGGAPNSHTCPVCTGMPGALPMLNRQVVAYALAVGLALNCEITRYCKFDRKNYFYPDNPQNYQISQLYLPICTNGWLTIETEKGAGEKRIGIHEIHMEEDAGKLVHDEREGVSVVDYNRAGVPLLEIVSEPDMRSADEVIAYLEKLRLIIQYLGASDCKLNEGSMRADINLSVRKRGNKTLGTRTEMKNLNSFREIKNAIKGERERQIACIEEGRRVVQETRRWDEKKGCSHAMRAKEGATDYRYFPEPDLMPVVISGEWIKEVQEKRPQMREEKLALYQEVFGIPAYDAKLLTSDKSLADLFERTVSFCARPKSVSNWIMGEVIRLMKEHGLAPDELSFSPENFAKLVALADEGSITNTVAKEVFALVFSEDIDPERYIEENGLKTIDDASALLAAVRKVIDENPQSVSDYLGGKKRALGFLVGQTMKATAGKADPGLVKERLLELLDDAGKLESD